MKQLPLSTMAKRLLAAALTLSIAHPALAAANYHYKQAIPGMASKQVTYLAPLATPSLSALAKASAGSTVVGSYTVTNPNEVPVSLGAPSNILTLSSNGCGSSLAAGASCTLSYTWSPATPGVYANATLQLPWTAGSQTDTLSVTTAIHAANPATFSLWSGSGGSLSPDGRTVTFPSSAPQWLAGASLTKEGPANGSQAAGKWYAEFTSPTAGTPSIWYGVTDNVAAYVTMVSNGYSGSDSTWGYYNGSSWVSTGYAYQANDTIGVAVDAAAGSVIYILKRAGSSTCTTVVTLSNVLPVGHLYSYVRRSSLVNASVTVNTGQSALHCAPSGYTPGWW